MSQGRPQLPGRGAVLYGVGPFLRRRPNANTGNGAAINTPSPAVRDCAPGPVRTVRSRSAAVPSHSRQAAVLNFLPTMKPQAQARALPPAPRTLAQWRLSGYTPVSLTSHHGTSAAQPAQPVNIQAGMMIPRTAQGASRVSRKRRTTSSGCGPDSEKTPKPAGWGLHKEYDDCCRGEKRKRYKAIYQINMFWDLHDKPVNNKLSILGELRPTEAMQNRGKGLHEKPTIDNYFAQQFYQKDDRDCGSNFLTLLSCFAQLFCGDRRARGLEILRRYANMRQTPSNGHMLFDIMELICDDITKALQEAALEKVILHPSQKLATQLDDMRSGVLAIDEQGLEGTTWGKEVPPDLRSWIKKNKTDSHKKLNDLVRLAAQMSRLTPRQFPVLQDSREIQIEMSFDRPGQPLSYAVEFPGSEFTYEDVMKDEFAPTVCEARMKFRLAQLKKRCKRQQRVIDAHMRQIHRRAMRCVEGRLISKKAHTRAVNDYIHAHHDEARQLHRALLKSARFKASVKLVQFHLHAQKMTFLHRIKWRGFERLDPGL
ncbi:hypothetical protein IWX90DRAFT_510294 [Phyllosticta citrichinensis]|uniref:Uncharacterized protein n=1 Tax=Phyllosticta citrichinensis TaxID=1130410 RepID=A0ABR1Y6L5_9PEZI